MGGFAECNKLIPPASFLVLPYILNPNGLVDSLIIFDWTSCTNTELHSDSISMEAGNAPLEILGRPIFQYKRVARETQRQRRCAVFSRVLSLAQK